MDETRVGRWAPWAAFVFYLAIALEAVIMITPFTVYFYSLYAPVLNRLEASPRTAWLTAFFLPHITYPGDGLLLALAWLGPVLLTLGLGVFLACAVQVYSAKLLRHGVVSRGLYRYIRHPQYLGLGIAGLGLLFYWPRFIILPLYLSMLFIYYLLARHEEWRMERKFGESYRQYKEKIAMFLPGEPGGKIFAWLTGGTTRKGWALGGLYLAVLIAGTGVAFGLRAHAGSRLPVVFTEGIVGISMSPLPDGEIQRIFQAVVSDPEVRPLLAKYHEKPGHTLVAYAAPPDYMMQHLIVDLGEHEAHHGGGAPGGILPVARHLGEMYLLRPMRQLGNGAATAEKRLIFTEALTARGADVPPGRALAPDVLRFPLFFADFDGTRVTMAMETPRKHSWGTIPVPAF